jgi:hypothetical protein
MPLSFSQAVCDWRRRSSGKMAPPGMKWRACSLQGCMTFTGGFTNKSYVLTTTEITVGDTIETFVKVDKNAEWLLKATMGNSGRKGALKRTIVIEQLKLKAEEITIPAVADPDKADPMNELDDVYRKQKTRGRKYVKKPPSSHIYKVAMPMYSPAAYPQSREEYTATVYLKGTNGNMGPQFLWLERKDVEWLVRTLADEAEFGSLNLQAAASRTMLPNSKVPGLNLKWDFQTEAHWEANFEEGPLSGTTVRSSVAKLNDEKWSAVAKQSGEAHVCFNQQFGTASPAQRKQATLDYVEAHCIALLLIKSSEDAASSRSSGECQVY